MSNQNKAVLEQANEAVRAGDNEGFLAFCTEDIVWSTVGGETLNGKEAVRAWMAEEYVQPPEFTVNTLIAEGDVVAAQGEIISYDDGGRPIRNAYCDVWRLREGKLAELKAYVVPLVK